MKQDLERDLFGYQKEDANKILDQGNFLCFSEMGTGKTPTALQVIEKGGYKCPLIVCPNSLRLEWKRQITDWTNSEAAVSTSDSYTKLKPIVDSFINGRKYKIINYETFRSKENLELLNMIPFDIIIFDEVHKLRNPKTKAVGGTWDFLNKHPEAKVLAMSGSPIMNYPNDLYVPLTLVKPHEYPRTMMNWRTFMGRYCLWSDGRYGAYVYGSRNLEGLKAETKDFIVRRTKKEVLPFLPDKYYRRSVLTMQKDQRELYDQMETELSILLDSGESLSSSNVLSALTRLRQINLDPKILGVTASSAKTDYLIDLIESTDEKIVIFSCFEKYIFFLSKLFPKSVQITGERTPLQRAEAVKQFQEQDEIQLCLGTIQSMGEGMTLTAASNVVLADRWWNEPTNQQAVDRLHRIGQKNAVQVMYPIVDESVDATLDSILERKDQASQGYFSESRVKSGIFEERLHRVRTEAL